MTMLAVASATTTRMTAGVREKIAIFSALQRPGDDGVSFPKRFMMRILSSGATQERVGRGEPAIPSRHCEQSHKVIAKGAELAKLIEILERRLPFVGRKHVELDLDAGNVAQQHSRAADDAHVEALRVDL